MTADPPVRDDGLCALDGCEKARAPEKSRKYAGQAADADPFCSTECCRTFHGAPRPATEYTQMHAPVAV